MRLSRTTERFGDLPSLQTFECRACGVAFTREAASAALRQAQPALAESKSVRRA